jgi:type I restriction enzyme M protein
MAPRKTAARKAPERKSVAPKPAAPHDRGKLEMATLEGWLWDAACAIRGAMDAPKFKDYILPLIFIKRLSDVYEDELARLAETLGDVETAADLAAQDHGLVRFYIPREAMWPELRKLTRDIGQRLTDAVRSIAHENESLQGVINIVDFNATVSGERIIGDEKLSALIEVISRHRIGLDDAEPDLLGRAYEYLLRKFAEGQGQSAGEFYTPREVGMILAYILDPQPGRTAYDPACGSAGLLIKLQLVCREKHDTAAAEQPLRLYGQEQSPVTYAMAKMNMAIHDMIGDDVYNVAIGDTLRNPKFLNGSGLKRFDLVVANPMWNQKGYDVKFYDEDPFLRPVHDGLPHRQHGRLGLGATYVCVAERWRPRRRRARHRRGISRIGEQIDRQGTRHSRQVCGPRFRGMRRVAARKPVLQHNRPWRAVVSQPCEAG